MWCKVDNINVCVVVAVTVVVVWLKEWDSFKYNVVVGSGVCSSILADILCAVVVQVNGKRHLFHPVLWLPKSCGFSGISPFSFFVQEESSSNFLFSFVVLSFLLLHHCHHLLFSSSFWWFGFILVIIVKMPVAGESTRS